MSFFRKSKKREEKGEVNPEESRYLLVIKIRQRDLSLKEIIIQINIKNVTEKKATKKPELIQIKKENSGIKINLGGRESLIREM